MRCAAPIFVIGFQRGGTNLLTNLLASHPDLRLLGRETHQVFYGKARETGKGRWIRRGLYLPIMLGAGGHLFRATNLEERGALPAPLGRWVDLLLDRESRSFLQYDPPPRGAASAPAPARSRLLAKNVNGMALATPILSAMYPDATFFAMVRHGLALCEGHVRRGRPAEEFGEIYQKVCDRMLRDAAAVPNYHLIRFEQLIADPVAAIRTMFTHARLDPDQVHSYRLQAKQSMGSDGRRSYTFGGQQDRETQWFGPDELRRCFRPDVDANQIARLAPEDRKRFLGRAGDVMSRLGYQ